MSDLTFGMNRHDSSDEEGSAQDSGGGDPASLSSSRPRKVLVRARSYEQDLAALEAAVVAAAVVPHAAAPADIAKLTLDARTYGSGPSSEIERRHYQISFGRFVDLLEQSMLPGRAAIRTFKIVQGSIYPNEYYREVDVVRLFRDVLPNHPTISRIELGSTYVSSTYVGLLAASVPSTRATPLRDLTLDFRPAEAGCVRDVCDMLRGDVPLRTLTLRSFASYPLTTDCQRIFQSLVENTHLQGLAIHPIEVSDCALCLASDAAPALRALHVEGRFTQGAVASAARQLRTNTTLVELEIASSTFYRDLVCAIEPVLATYNFTLRRLRIHDPSPSRRGSNPGALFRNSSIPRSLRRNERIRQALEQLPTYRVTPTARWPLVLGLVSDLPTLLYRFLRRGDINALGDLVAEARPSQPHPRTGGQGDTGSRRTRSRPSPQQSRRSRRMRRT
jgi:hypothetical protein